MDATSFRMSAAGLDDSWRYENIVGEPGFPSSHAPCSLGRSWMRSSLPC